MRFKFIFTAVLICFLELGNANAGDLHDALNSALKTHPSIEGAYLGYKASEEGRKVEFSKYYPEISVNLTAARAYQDNSTSRGLVTERGAAYTGVGEGRVSLRQMVFDGLETKNRVVAAEARIESSNYNLLNIEDSLILRVSQIYVDILRLSNSLKILEEQKESIRDYEDRITDMVSENLSDEVELQQARDVSMLIDGVISEYKGQFASALAAYHESVGEKFSGNLKFMPKTLDRFIIKDIATSVDIAKQQHPLLQSSRMDSKAARHDMKAEHGKLYPDISSEVSYSKNDKKDVVGGETKDARIGVNMNWSFSIGGGDVSSVRQKRYEHYKATAVYKTLEGEIERDIHRSYATYNTIKSNVELSKDRVGLNEKLLDAYNNKFQGGLISLLSLMRAESQLFNARLAYEENKYYMLSSQYDLLASVGQLKNVLMSLSVTE